ncbi:MAG: D-glycero-alpha-D-manno-heptose-1,7-bisphosphate 7-phosphatase [Chloroflexota bacterium]
MKAVFLDRDGVLNDLALNPATGAWESPHAIDEIRIAAGAPAALADLASAGFALFIVSNQPSYAKGKISLDALREIATHIEDRFRSEGIAFTETFYCLHHPAGIVPEVSGPCACRKPSPWFLLAAADRHDIDLAASWMVGDRDTDIACGSSAGCRTILIANPRSAAHQGTDEPTSTAASIGDAARIILTAGSGSRRRESSEGGTG